MSLSFFGSNAPTWCNCGRTKKEGDWDGAHGHHTYGSVSPFGLATFLEHSLYSPPLEFIGEITNW
jgi:hypothetical protein